MCHDYTKLLTWTWLEWFKYLSQKHICKEGVHAHFHVGTLTCACMWLCRPDVDARCLPPSLSILFFEAGISLNLELKLFNDVCWPVSSMDLLVPLWALKTLLYPEFTWVPGIWIQVRMLAQWQVTYGVSASCFYNQAARDWREMTARLSVAVCNW